MTRKKTKAGDPAPASGTLIERMTDQINRIRLLIAALTALAAAGYVAREKLAGLLDIGPRSPSSCVQVNPATFPKELRLEEWGDTPIRLNGRNECPVEFGLYVTFRREFAADQQLFALSSPHADLPECKGLSSDLVPACWNSKKPIRRGKGEWQWDVRLPPLEPLRDPGIGERIRLSWAVRDYDDPTKPAIVADTAAIVVQK
jgi:hypothetical protein